MLGRFQPVEFNPYGRRRSRRLVPRWLLMLLAGIVVGAGAVVFVQERYLPQRLSPEASAELRTAIEQAEADRLRLRRELEELQRQYDAAMADNKNLGEEVTISRETIAGLRNDVTTLVAALPPDPRGGPIEVRAAKFALEGDALAYDVVLTREGGADAGKPPFAGVMQFVVAAEPTRSGAAGRSVTLEPVALSVGLFESLRGKQTLPDGFKPQRVTVQVLDRVDGKRLGMRVINVR